MVLPYNIRVNFIAKKLIIILAIPEGEPVDMHGLKNLIYN